MKTQSTLIWPDGTVKLDAESTVDVDVAIVVCPGNSELNKALWLDESLDDTGVSIFRMSL